MVGQIFGKREIKLPQPGMKHFLFERNSSLVSPVSGSSQCNWGIFYRFLRHISGAAGTQTGALA